MRTNQQAVQFYTGNWLGATPRKLVHGGPSSNYPKWSGLAIEQQGYTDAINNPEWGQDHICQYSLTGVRAVRLILVHTDGPGRDFVWTTSYAFSVMEATETKEK